MVNLVDKEQLSPTQVGRVVDSLRISRELSDLVWRFSARFELTPKQTQQIARYAGGYKSGQDLREELAKYTREKVQRMIESLNINLYGGLAGIIETPIENLNFSLYAVGNDKRGFSVWVNVPNFESKRAGTELAQKGLTKVIAHLEETDTNNPELKITMTVPGVYYLDILDPTRIRNPKILRWSDPLFIRAPNPNQKSVEYCEKMAEIVYPILSSR